jgi:hypothetical protein
LFNERTHATRSGAPPETQARMRTSPQRTNFVCAMPRWLSRPCTCKPAGLNIRAMGFSKTRQTKLAAWGPARSPLLLVNFSERNMTPLGGLFHLALDMGFKLTTAPNQLSGPPSWSYKRAPPRSADAGVASCLFKLL